MTIVDVIELVFSTLIYKVQFWVVCAVHINVPSHFSLHVKLTTINLVRHHITKMFNIVHPREWIATEVHTFQLSLFCQCLSIYIQSNTSAYIQQHNNLYSRTSPCQYGYCSQKQTLTPICKGVLKNVSLCATFVSLTVQSVVILFFIPLYFHLSNLCI